MKPSLQPVVLLPGLLLSTLLIIGTEPAHSKNGPSQTPPECNEQHRNKPEFEQNFVVGLTLSGGGAAGLAHIGVLKVFEEAGIPVDLVTGTSTGSIVGALYAMGYTAEQIEQEIRRTDWRQVFDERIHRKHLPMEEKHYDGLFKVSFPVEGRQVKLPTGLVSGNHIFNMLARLTWPYHDLEDFTKLPRPFLCVATDLETGEQVILDRGFLPDAIRASMSIPSVFDPVWLDGKYLVDGGVLNNMPVQEAYDLGADFVIAVNSSSDLKPADELLSLPDIITQTIAVGMRNSMHLQRDKADFYIQPDLSRYTTLSFGEVDEIIQAGEHAARLRFDEIKALADSLNHLRSGDIQPPTPAFQPLERFRIRSIIFEGLKTVPRDHIISKLQIKSNTVIDEAVLTEGLLRLYGMQRFKRVAYRLSWSDTGDEADLIIHVKEQTDNIIQIGIFHNNKLGPSLLFNASFRNLFFPASTARLNLRIGHEALAEVRYFNYVGIEPRLAFHGSAGFKEQKRDIYRNNHREAEVQTDIFYGEILTGPLYGSIFSAGFGYRYEYFNLTESIGFLDIPSRWTNLHLLLAEIELDNLNRSNMPVSGHHLIIRADLAPDFLPNDSAFGRFEGNWKGHYPVSDRLTLIHTIRGGYSFSGNMPLHYLFYAGGYQSFVGYRKDALADNNILSTGLAAQFRFYSNFYATPAIQIGNAYPRINHDLFHTPIKWGWKAKLSWNTVLGPIETALMGSSDHALLLEFQIGMNF